MIRLFLIIFSIISILERVERTIPIHFLYTLLCHKNDKREEVNGRTQGKRNSNLATRYNEELGIEYSYANIDKVLAAKISGRLCIFRITYTYLYTYSIKGNW